MTINYLLHVTSSPPLTGLSLLVPSTVRVQAQAMRHMFVPAVAFTTPRPFLRGGVITNSTWHHTNAHSHRNDLWWFFAGFATADSRTVSLKCNIRVSKRTCNIITVSSNRATRFIQTHRWFAVINGTFELRSGLRREHWWNCSHRANRPWYWSRWAIKHFLFACLWIDPRSPAKLLCESCRSIKHWIHGFYAWDVPLRYVTIKWCRIKKHALHVRHPRHIPLWEIVVEWFSNVKHGIHAPYPWHVPLW